MYGVSTDVMPKVIDPGRRLVIEWDGYTGRTTVEWKFLSMNNDATFVSELNLVADRFPNGPEDPYPGQ
jgi:hypothetical protein